eukprot:711020-Prorocentrum_minimum.AAC.2
MYDPTRFAIERAPFVTERRGARQAFYLRDQLVAARNPRLAVSHAAAAARPPPGMGAGWSPIALGFPGHTPRIPDPVAQHL